MGLLSTAVTFTRYKLLAPIPDDFWNWAHEKVVERSFQDREGLDEYVAGWTPFDRPFQSNIHLTDMSFAGFLVLGMRVDVRRVPSTVLKKYCALEEERLKQEKGLNRLSKKMLTEIRNNMRLQLLSRAIPVPSLTDFMWDIESGDVFLFARQDRLRMVFEDLFKATFDMLLTPVAPYSLAVSLLKADALKLKALEEVASDAWI
ncbi:MAG: recombination-associated protein RdgC [Dissulfuribacterales bacterium]